VNQRLPTFDRQLRGDVDDPTATRCHHVRRSEAAAQEHAAQVDVDHLVPGSHVHLDELDLGEDAGAAHEHVEPPVALDQPIEQAAHLLGVCDVERDRIHLERLSARSGRERVDPGAVAVGGYDERALAGEVERDGSADTAGSPGHHRHLTLEPCATHDGRGAHSGHRTVRPPSTMSCWPVTYAAS